MATSYIVRKGGGDPAVIDGEFLLAGEYQEAIARFDTVYGERGNLLELNKLPDPATLPTNQGTSTAFSTDGTYLTVAYDISPFITIYKNTYQINWNRANNQIIDTPHWGYALEDSPAQSIEPVKVLFKK